MAYLAVSAGYSMLQPAFLFTSIRSMNERRKAFVSVKSASSSKLHRSLAYVFTIATSTCATPRATTSVSICTPAADFHNRLVVPCPLSVADCRRMMGMQRLPGIIQKTGLSQPNKTMKCKLHDWTVPEHPNYCVILATLGL
jgi:hypothetical protein